MPNYKNPLLRGLGKTDHVVDKELQRSVLYAVAKEAGFDAQDHRIAVAVLPPVVHRSALVAGISPQAMYEVLAESYELRSIIAEAALNVSRTKEGQEYYSDFIKGDV